VRSKSFWPDILPELEPDRTPNPHPPKKAGRSLRAHSAEAEAAVGIAREHVRLDLNARREWQTPLIVVRVGSCRLSAATSRPNLTTT
jgi:hypothetical protein